MDQDVLFQPGQLGSLRVENRIFMAPLTRSRADNPAGAPTAIHQKYYQQRAAAGLIISEGTVVSPQGVGYPNVPGIYSEEQVWAWKRVTDAVHARGGKIFIQLWHVGRISHPDFQNGAIPVGPSAINPDISVQTPAGKKSSVTPHALTLDEIQGIVNDFRRAASNALLAGFDGVEIHASNGYLFHQFFNNSSNQRTDAYGGSDENKSRLLFEVIDAIRELVPVSRIGVRLNPMMHGSGGIVVDADTAGTFEHIIKKLNDYSLAYLHLSKPWKPQDDAVHVISDVIGHFGALYDGFLIANGNYQPDLATTDIASGRADAVAFGRLFISNPDLPARIQNEWPLVKPNPTTYYTTGEKGYTDYPRYQTRRY